MKIANIKWEKGSLNSTAIGKFKEMGIDYHYSHFGELLADPYGVGLYLPVKYRRGDLESVFISMENHK